MNIKYKYGDIEVSYEERTTNSKIELDKDVMDFVYNKFLDLYNLKKQEDKESIDVVAELCKMHKEKDNG